MRVSDRNAAVSWRAIVSLAAACTLAATLTACTPTTDPDPDSDTSSTNEGVGGQSADDNTDGAVRAGTGDEGGSSDTDAQSNDTSSGSSSSSSSGSSSSGSSSSGSGGDSGSGSTSGGIPAAGPSASPSSAPPAGPSITSAVTSQRCSSGSLIVAITANFDGSYRKGITAVTFERQNEYNSWLDFDGTWLGQYTGQGNVWNGSLAGNQQNIGKTLRVTVFAGIGAPSVYTTPITSPC